LFWGGIIGGGMGVWEGGKGDWVELVMDTAVSGEQRVYMLRGCCEMR
jgi:hypothetical protein